MYALSMTQTLTTKLKIVSWDEQPTKQFDDGSKTTQAEVTLAEGTDGLTSGSSAMLLYYRPDGTSTYVSLMRVTATLEGRSGSFVLQGEGTFDGTSAVGSTAIVAGSGTGDLAGITGTSHSTSTHADYPYMPLTLTYDLG